MTHEDAGHYAAKHSLDTRLDPKIAGAIKKKISEGKITCAAASKIADKLGVSPADVGVAIDLMEVRISRCQLGLFGYSPEQRIVKPAENVTLELEDMIRKSLVNNRLSCASAWGIARKMSIPKMSVSAACEALKIKISSCQLGSFR
jgi:alkyl sulfatase BDS1-like metallo-beta-lactamase superfamily hydrolase